MKKQLSQTLYTIASLLAILGAIAQFLDQFFAPHIFSVGATLIIILQFVHVLNLRTKSMREQRIGRIGLFASMLLALASYSMFTHSNLWVVALLIYALVTLFLSFRGE